MESHESCCRTVGDVLTHTLIQAMENKEAELDEEINRLDNMQEEDLEELRRKRLDQLKSTAKKQKELQQFGHGEYAELMNEKDFFEAAKKSKHLVCHFYRPSTWRCAIIDKHLESLARTHIECRFVKINIENSPYLAEKLRIVMLPTVMIVNEGKTEHSIIGFDEFGGKDDFETEDVETVLCNRGALHRK
jgi:hypothetical protein